MPWIEVPDFGGMISDIFNSITDAFDAAGDAVFGKDIEYDTQKSKAPNGLNLYTISIKLESGDVQIVQIQFGLGAFHTFFTPHPKLDSRTAAFIAHFITGMQAQWVLDPEKIEVK